MEGSEKRLMKKTIIGVSIIVIIAVIVIGGTIAYFSDQEKSENNTMSSATFDIDDEGSWTKSYSMSNMYPGKDPEIIDFTLRNMGSLPMRVWMVIKNVNNEENGISDSEQDWYDQNGGPKNNLDEAVTYGLKVDGSLALEQGAGITVDQIKDYYINLVKTDQPFDHGNGDGILHPGDTIDVEQKFYLPPATENWAQSDIMNFEIEILAQQVDVNEPIKQLSFIQNKYTSGGWHIIDDERVGVLKYDSYAENFNYDFLGRGLTPGTEYNLIYYPDPWASPKDVLVISGIMTVDSEENINNIGQSLNIENLPWTSDDNKLYGAKIWLVISSKLLDSQIAGNTSRLTWSVENWLFDGWPGLINYKQSTDGSSTTEETINFVDLNSDPQFGPLHDYSTANVSFAYETPANDRLSGTITATGIKPYATYQAKFVSKPVCNYPVDGDDTLNELIGYKGRWTCLDCSCSGAGCNRTDTQYETNKALADTNPSKECIAGYLAWDYFTADASGNATKFIETANSYHVLWCGGGICGQANNSQLITLGDPGFQGYPTCDIADVNGQIERFTCNGLILDEGNYDLDFVLTEESFHQSTYGTWTAVMSTDVNFIIE